MNMKAQKPINKPQQKFIYKKYQYGKYKENKKTPKYPVEQEVNQIYHRNATNDRKPMLYADYIRSVRIIFNKQRKPFFIFRKYHTKK